MYITYNTMQWSQHDERRFLNQHVRPPIIIPSNLSKPASDFMPQKLVRVSDMQVVPGSKVHEGYCALSYSANQSGEIIVDRITGKHKRIDHGKHKIIRKGRVLSEKTHHVKFEGIIQRIAKDFNIKYIWYDQMCMDQQDEKEKNHEIQHMHQIYSNAYCTVVLVPEFHVDVMVLQLNRQEEIKYGKPVEQSILESAWFKRLWTLLEALSSSSLLFVGTDTHAWWVEDECLRDINIITKPSSSEKWNAATILFHAHIRKCSNEYDRIFAVANLFPDILSDLTINYHQPLIDLMIQFYGLLAKKDITMLCFGEHNKYKNMGRQSSSNTKSSRLTLPNHIIARDDNYLVPIQKYKNDMPSWTGVSGEHIPNNMLKTFFQNYTITEKIMHVTCSGITTTTARGSHQQEQQEEQRQQPFIKINNNPFILTYDDFLSLIPPEDNESFSDEESHHFWKLGLLARFPGHQEDKILILPTISIQTIKEELLLDSSSSMPPSSNQNNGKSNINGHQNRKLLNRRGSKRKSNKNRHYNLNNEQIMDSMAQELRLLSHFMPTIQKEDLFWFKTTGLSVPYSEFRIDLTEQIDASSEYVILSGIPFINDNPRNDYYPILKKRNENEEHYKAIGLCKISNTKYFFSNYTPPEEQAFSIE
ncbi:heterokaryon incompatibility protein-domain-containing protein [Phascolomyces articulosus]|uniref:Heterokaryon incompatibility protein-domain-containing protein n=1 Tax=Phascolomyces articulosus TaxID=60185 RepID=A0AAD5KQP7_9FUNG|nr:heterokaryon incompatibility protein-domain-containing protein [Phascolomyces articulosus]